MKCKNIPFGQISSIPILIKDFLSKEEYKNYHFSLDNILIKSEEKKGSFSLQKRETLCNVIAQQMLELELSEKQIKNLDLLRQENVFTITTGHQLNLFTGSSFFIYKILQTIKTADFLNQQFQDKKFVPIFWLATEDHDFEEINYFKTQNYCYQITGKQGGAVGKIEIKENHFITDFIREFKDDVYGTELILWLQEAYKIGNTLTQACKILVNRLFGDRGILMIDGDHLDLKKSMTKIFSDELENQRLKNTIQKKIDNFNKIYGKVQVTPRDINLFYLSDNERNRIEPKNNKYFITNTNLEFTKNELLSSIENISPNALMRPIYQENILPNVMYIGGNAEIMYWLELQDYFKALNIPFPILMPRSSILFLSEKIVGKLKKLGLEIDDFFKDYSMIVKQKILSESELKDIIDIKEEEIKAAFALLKDKASLTDKTFRNLVEAEGVRQLKSYARMRKRLLRAEKIRQLDKYTQLNRLYLDIHPEKKWQERVFNFSVFYSQYGKNWLETCYNLIDVEKSILAIFSIK